jgi:ABC-2 type transport system permease protein
MLYLSLFKISFQRMMAYRAATLAGIATNFFFGLLRAYVFIAVFDASGKAIIGNYDMQDTITYTALTQALGMALAIITWNWDMMKTIQTGEIVSDLTKPFNFFNFWLARDLGRSVFLLIFRGSPIMFVYPFMFALTWPESVLQWLAFLLSILLAMMVSFGWRFLVNMTAFWLVDAIGVGRFAWLIMGFLSGFFIPVGFFPDWLKVLVSWTPFPSIVNTPIEVYLGIVNGEALGIALLTQVAWFSALSAAGLFLFSMGRRRLVIQGG